MLRNRRTSVSGVPPPPPSGPAWRERPRDAGAWLLHVAAQNAGGAVYGTVMIGVLLAAEDARREGYLQTIGAAAIVVVLYWLTSFYTHSLGDRLRTRDPLSKTLFWRSALHELSIIEGAFIPIIALLVAWALGASVASGVNAALWTVGISIVGLEIIAGWRARLRPRSLWLQAAVGVLIGSAIIALKLVLH